MYMDMDLISDSKAEEKGKGKVSLMDMDLGTAEAKGNKVCVMLGLSGSIGFFMLKLDEDRDLNENGFVEIQPNLRVALSFYPHVVKDTLYLFDDDTDTRARIPPHVYTIKLQKVSEMVGRGRKVVGVEEVRSETEFTRLSDCRARKSRRMRTLSYRDSILVFSSQIGLHYYYDDENGDKYQDQGFHNLKDFELYHPDEAEGEGEGKGKSDVLPQLIVCRPRFSCSDRLKLYDYDESTFYDDEFPAFGSFARNAISYSIVSFGVDLEEDKFVIETDFGRMFSLKLDGSDERWRLCDEGYEFVSHSHNVVTSNGICLDAYGANDSRTRWLKQQQQEQSRRDGDDANKRPRIAAPSQSHSQEDETSQEDESSQDDESSRRLGFPPFLREIESCGLVSGYGRHSSAFDFLKLNGDPSCTLCTVRQAFDPINMDNDTSSNSYFFLGVLKLNLQKLEEEFPEEEFPDSKDYDKFVKSISFKFFVPGKTYNPTPFVPGVFYY